MNFIKSHSLLMIFSLVLGIGIFGTAKSVNAQKSNSKSKSKMEKKQKQENDDDDDDDEPTPAEQAKLAKKAKITKEQAQAIALKEVPGEIIESEIEKENGILVWGFDIRRDDGKIWDVEIDAKTGKVLKSEEDTEDEDENESEDTEDEDTSRNRTVFEKTAKESKHINAGVFHGAI